MLVKLYEVIGYLHIAGVTKLLDIVAKREYN